MNNKKYEIIALFGESASGKDTIQKMLVSNLENANKIIGCTTRPPRDYEINGQDYYFLDKDTFVQEIVDHNIIGAANFNNWYYGTYFPSLKPDAVNIGVFSIKAIKQLLKDNRLEVHPVYIYASEKTRLLRSINREENPNCEEICRRFLADKKDFESVDFKYDFYNNDADVLNHEYDNNNKTR